MLRTFCFVTVCAACASCSVLYDLDALRGDVLVTQPGLTPQDDAGRDAGDREGGGEVEAGPVPDPPRSGPCRPASDAGAAMVWAGTFCIDATEVSNAAYQTFLETDAGASADERAALLPEGAWPPESNALALPVVGVSWHAAHAYCGFVGKRLCGRVGGGELALSQDAAAASEWYAACSKDGSRVYPYGDELIPGECATQGQLRYLFGTPCEGGYRGLLNMVGNAAEWTAACHEDTCNLQGGSALDQRADCAWTMPLKKTHKWPLAGIRCCADSP